MTTVESGQKLILYVKSLIDKWKPDSKKFINHPCSFCHDAGSIPRDEETSTCDLCKIDKAICNSSTDNLYNEVFVRDYAHRYKKVSYSYQHDRERYNIFVRALKDAMIKEFNVFLNGIITEYLGENVK